MSRKFFTYLSVTLDFLAALLSWILFYYYRKNVIEPERFGVPEPEWWLQKKFILSCSIIPLAWVAFYAFLGTYQDVLRRSRLQEMIETIRISIIGNALVFFFLVLDDFVRDYRDYYKIFFLLFISHSVPTVSFRLIISSYINGKIHRKEFGFPTLLIGSNHKALEIYKTITGLKKGAGYDFIGFVHIREKNGMSDELKSCIRNLGEYEELPAIIKKYRPEEAIIALESHEHAYLKRIVDDLADYGIIIKITPDMYNILAGQVKMNSLFDAPLIIVEQQVMPPWQRAVKRFMDIFFSLSFMILFCWLYLLIAIIIKCTSEGPVFFRQVRIGLHGRPFYIIKFRTMVKNAETNGPMLSSASDPRVTPFGKFLRKYRLDEIPQFWNVLKGEMSLVGPRPEREYYIEQIMKYAPHYKHLKKVRPGITSWGQVKYGYAENVEQMIARLEYDILYVENMSLLLDIKILIYTFLTIVSGKGK